MKKTLMKENTVKVVPQVSPKPIEDSKIIITSITFDKNGNLYGIGDGILHRFSFDTKEWFKV